MMDLKLYKGDKGARSCCACNRIGWEMGIKLYDVAFGANYYFTYCGDCLEEMFIKYFNEVKGELEK